MVLGARFKGQLVIGTGTLVGARDEDKFFYANVMMYSWLGRDHAAIQFLRGLAGDAFMRANMTETQSEICAEAVKSSGGKDR